jgi:hypothetical protein
LLLIKRPAPINKEPLDMSNGVHHAFMIDATEYPSALDGCARRVSISFSRKTDAAARSTGLVPISATQTAPLWSL